MIRPALHDRVRYTFVHKNHGRQVVIEPEGWENNDEEYARHKTDFGLMTKFTNNSAYFKGALTFIDDVLEKYGINAKINVIREERHPKTNAWTETFNQFLDLLEYSKGKGKIKIKANAGGLEEQLKSFENEKFEIEKLESVTGEVIEPLESRLLELKGRRIFKRTQYDIKESENNALLFSRSENNDANYRGVTVPIPLHIIGDSHEEFSLSPIYNSESSDGTLDRSIPLSISNIFLYNVEKERTFKIKFSFTFKINVLQFDDINFSHFWLYLTKYKNGADLNLDAHISNLFYSSNIIDDNNKTISVSFDQDVTLQQGQSLGLNFHQVMYRDAWHTAHMEVDCTEIKGGLTIEENSFFEESTTKVILAHELLERIVYIITGVKGLVYSEAFGRKDLGYKEDGEWAYLSFSNGFWIRKFEEEALSVSLKDLKGFMSACLGMSTGIETVGEKQILVAEPFKYFFQDFVGVRLPYEIDDSKESVAKQFYFSAIEIGSNKGGEYEEIMGLNEYNTKSNWTTAITVTDNKYTKTSNIRRDSYGQEIPRRKPKLTHPTEDTRYDSDVTVFDAKKGVSQILEQRYWQDDLDEEPKNIYSPETATNLRLTDTRCMLRHSVFLRVGLTKYLDKKVIFASSIGNSTLITKKNGVEIIENGSILNNELNKEAFVPMLKKFNHKVSFEVLEQLKGTTNINGREVSNLFGLVEYVEKGEVKYGRFWSVKPKGKGQFELLKAEI